MVWHPPTRNYAAHTARRAGKEASDRGLCAAAGCARIRHAPLRHSPGAKRNGCRSRDNRRTLLLDRCGAMSHPYLRPSTLTDHGVRVGVRDAETPRHASGWTALTTSATRESTP